MIPEFKNERVNFSPKQFIKKEQNAHLLIETIQSVLQHKNLSKFIQQIQIDKGIH